MSHVAYDLIMSIFRQFAAKFLALDLLEPFSEKVWHVGLAWKNENRVGLRVLEGIS